MKGNKCSLFHVYMYHVILVATGAAASRAVCSPVAAVYLVPLAHGVELFVFAEPPPNHLGKCRFFPVGPVGYNLKNQNSFEEQIMQLQVSSNIESH